MQCNEARQLCNNYRGQVVRIYDKSGKEHYGRITKVTEDRVWFEPADTHRQNYNYNNNHSSRNSNRNRNDYHSGYSNRNHSNRDSNRNFREDRFNNNFRKRDNFRCGFFGCGFAVSIAIGFIAGIALAALFFF